MATSVQILNLGLFRTGTTSLRHALMWLGYDNVYHMETIFSPGSKDPEFWVQAFDAKFGSAISNTHTLDFGRVLSDYNAVSDLPCAAFAEELIARYPDAKVILTVRDSADVWLESVLRTVWTIHRESPFSKGKLLGSPWLENSLPSPFRMGRRMFRYLFNDDLPRKGKHVYQSHNARIISMVPKERLLVFNVKQGWAPLAEFLGVDVSKELETAGFPHLNDAAAFVQKMRGRHQVFRQKLKQLVLRACGLVLAFALCWTIGVFLAKQSSQGKWKGEGIDYR